MHQLSYIQSFKLSVFIPLIMLGGCGNLLSAAGPSRDAITSNATNQNYQIVDLSASTIALYMKPSEPPVSSSVALPSIPEIRLVPGDVLRIVISDSAAEGSLFAPLTTGGTVFENVRVDSRGSLSLPYVGRQSVQGRTLPEVEVLIRARLKGIVSDVQVQVAITGDLSGSVLVAGAVKSPGRFSALEGPLTLLDALNRAGGPQMEPHLSRVIVRTGEKSYAFNYEDLLGGRNQLVPPGAEIVVERARKRFVAMGAVGDPGLHDLPSSNPSLLEVLGVVKGLNESKADSSGVFVFRLTNDTDPVTGMNAQKASVFRLNMKEPEAMFIARQFLVQPEDAIYVTNAAIYEWQKIISPIVQVLVLGRVLQAM